jgi:hypothetical protein
VTGVPVFELRMSIALTVASFIGAVAAVAVKLGVLG